MVAVGPRGRVALRTGHDRRGQRQAAGAAVRARVRLLRPRVSPDGRFIVCQRERHATAERPIDVTLVVLDADAADASGPGRDLLPGFDRWPTELAWSHDSRALYFAADDGGRRPVFRVDTDTGEVTRVTGDDGAYTDLNPGPDGRYLYALRATVDSPPTPVRIDLTRDLRGRARRAGLPRRPGHGAGPAGGGARRPPMTVSRSGPGSCCRPRRRRTARRRCCSGCTAGR